MPETLKDSVRTVLEAMLEGRGIGQWDADDLEVCLGDEELWVRVNEKESIVSVYRVLDEVPCSWDSHERLLTLNQELLLHRVILQDRKVVLRADLPADPFTPHHLQKVLDKFEDDCAELSAMLAEWPSWGGP